ncbi:hypothetical protein FB639_004265 [Coemansia asiatica]|nr:hypothetical protein FB639_004265 [Coemansia asiatica]
MTYFVFRNVKDPLKSAYISNYVFTSITICMLLVPSFPFAEVKKMRFPVFKKEMIGTLILVAWYMSIATFLVSDPVFRLSKNSDGNNTEKAVYPLMAAVSCSFALASALGIVTAVLNTDKPKPTPNPEIAVQV